MEGLPRELREDGARHPGMADYVVRLAKNLFLRIAGNPQKYRIGIGDPTLQVGLGDDDCE